MTGGAGAQTGKAMAKSREGRGGRGRPAAPPPRLRSPGHAAGLSILFQRAEAVDLESFLATAPRAKPNSPAPFVAGLSPGAQMSARTAKIEANRCALEGARLVNEGRPAEAIPLLRRSVQIDPSVAASQHDLGVALMGAGQLEQAAQALSAAVRLDPGMATAHQFLGFLFDNLGGETKAIAAYEAAVALKRDLVAAQFRLGELYLVRGRRGESVEAFRAAAAAAAGTVWARIAEVNALEVSSAFDEALSAARALAEAHPETAEAQVILGKLLGQAGFSAEAAAHHLRGAELAPDMGAAWTGLALNKKFAAADDSVIALMNGALSRPSLAPRQRLGIHFALGKAHDDLGDYREAMRNFDAANALRARWVRLNRDALVRRVDRLIAATPRSERDLEPHSGVEDATPMLIVGLPRSGSTLTEQILSSHPDVAAGGELEFWTTRDAPREDIGSIISTAEATRRLAADYLATLRTFGPHARRITDKMLSNFMRLGIVHRVFPNATFVHCRRNLIDNALSIFTTNFDTNISYASERGDLVFYIRQYQRLMAHWRAVLPEDRLVEVDYEALVADPEPQARRLVAACGLEWSDACLAPHRNVRTINTASLWQARQPIYRTSVERWRRYEPWLGELRELAPEA